MTDAPADPDKKPGARARAMPSWLRIVAVLFAAVALFDDLRALDWTSLSPSAAALTSAWIVMSYGAVALLAWSAAASATAIALSYALCLVLDEYSITLLCGCVVMVGAVAMLRRAALLAHLAVTVAWVAVTAWMLDGTDFFWALGLPLGIAALVGVAVRFFVGEYRLNARRLAAMEATHERLREQERLALARDLHDVVAHELTLVTMQAAGSQRQTDPTELHRTIDTMDTAARSGLTELRTLLHLLRDPHGPAPDGAAEAGERGSASGLTTGSLHGVAQTLESSLERAGLHPQFVLDEGVDDIPTSIRGTAARVLQEASTNMIKYAPTGSPCLVRMTAVDSTVHIHTENRVSPGTQELDHRELSSGFGLRGIRERVALLDGRVDYGAHDHTWHLDVRIPVS
ncbi:sensor histidine kinase [Kocuria sp.]|uniref:sensor histidine kinase n=1 Tax=Kocuria sp. TaxID=1871328 RepID=UPI0026DDC790|nr:histidine kinase [Kocuria sp.]MDO4918262.1 histidine kinase [Kocuria sp.]